jgi:phage repressor protein C with HTH and peptisase S24 domain
MREISFLKQNILKYLEFKGVSKYEFYQKTGVSNGILSQKNGLSEENTLRFLSYYKDVNPEWLITGKGNMLKPNMEEMPYNESMAKSMAFSEETKNTINAIHSNEPDKEYEGIPLIPIDAMAGWGSGDVQVMDYESKKYVIPEFTELNVDFMLRIKGSSMYPKYNSGDLVACKKLVLNDIFFQWNKVYVLDTDQGALIKRIKKGSDNHLLIVSDNLSYEPYELHLSKIHAIAIVLGVIRLE